MVDARVSGARAARRAGSIPVLGTIKKRGTDSNVGSSFRIIPCGRPNSTATAILPQHNGIIDMLRDQACR